MSDNNTSGSLDELLDWARENKEDASDIYHDRESGSFEQGIVLGRRHAMDDVIQFILERKQDTGSSQ